jgi:hypothetical protein
MTARGAPPPAESTPQFSRRAGCSTLRGVSVLPSVRALVALVVFTGAGLLASAPLACGDDASDGPRPEGGVLEAAGGDDAKSPDAPDGPPRSRGTRVLGLEVSIDDTDLPSNSLAARDAGAETTGVTFGWNEIERPYDAGLPDAAEPDAAMPPPTTLFNPGLHVVNLVLSDRRLQAALAVEAFDVGGSRTPADLAGKPLDDPAVGARYDALLDYVFSQIGDTQVTALFVATGADVWVEADAQRAAPLAAFVARAAAHARALRPGLRVGITVDDLDRAGARSALLAAAWASSDFVGVDYVPSAAVARGDAPAAVVRADFDRMTTFAPAGKPLFVRQAGYPTDPAAGPAASEENQAIFVGEVFAAWDRNPDQIAAIVFRELVDVTLEEASARASRRGVSDASFVALERSLGLRGRDGRMKQGSVVLRREATRRGW